MKQTYYAIVGAGPAGIAAAEAIRTADSGKPLMLFNGENTPPYCRPLVVEALTGERRLSDITLRDVAWYEAQGITLSNGNPVVGIDAEARQIRLESGDTVAYEKLLLATGSVPFVPPIPGLSEVPAHTLYCTRDVESLRPLCQPGARALVLGIGLIGLQALTALKGMGLHVTAVEARKKVLPLILDREAADLAGRRIEANGVDLRIGTKVVEFVRNGAGFSAVTDGGDSIPFDVLILATGMKPDKSLFENAGISVKGGVQVSPAMETSVPGIYAAGDVTEYPNWVEGRNEVHAHWLNATRQGRIAGQSMAGVAAETYEPVYLNSLSIFGLPIITMGCSRIDEPKDALVLVDRVAQRPWYRRLIVKDGKLVAATFVNDVEGGSALQYLLREQVPLTDDVARSLFVDGAAGVQFMDSLHREAVRGGLEWPESMDLIDKFKKNMSHTRWA